MKNIFPILAILTLFSSCIPMQKVPKDAKMTDFFHFQKSENYNPSKWAVFLPGTGGLRIFNDTTHYYKMAEKLNGEGYSVLLVDNAAAYKASKRKVKEEEPAEIIWTLEQAMQWAHEENHISKNSKGSLVGWSRAGLGVIPIANSQRLLDSLNIKNIVLFYPANGHELNLRPKVPVLVLTGAQDRIVKVDDILKHMVAENVSIKIYDDAYHGFDVESLKKGKYFRYIPFISKKIYLLKYNEEAAQDAVKQMIDFIAK